MQDLINKIIIQNTTINASFNCFNETIEDKIRERVKKETQGLRLGQTGTDQSAGSKCGKSAMEQQLIETQMPAQTSTNQEARESLIKILNSKANQRDIDLIKETKTNKYDSDM